ncbi:hypothetical protein [Endozoicomonas elysicola]|uniref:Uncharacterized protein n=1 Tax=Endozoicomonas elysicola TaxID=305900 RepID=A0A081K6J0_9GAMM|nr:hypothetical protein [Endozoicomonas elysicola]KEI69766.1 hypothetical protein GV64_02535 [Endozoicomonas elysicola]
MDSHLGGSALSLSSTHNQPSDSLSVKSSESGALRQRENFLPSADSNKISHEPQPKKVTDFDVMPLGSSTAPKASIEDITDPLSSSDTSPEHKQELQTNSPSRNSQQPIQSIGITKTISKDNYTPLIGRSFSLQTNKERICVLGFTKVDSLGPILTESRASKEITDESRILGWYQVMVTTPKTKSETKPERPVDSAEECSDITSREPVDERVRLVYLYSRRGWGVENSNAQTIPIQKVRNDDGTFRYCIRVESKPMYNVSACILPEDSAKELLISMVSTTVESSRIEKGVSPSARIEPLHEGKERLGQDRDEPSVGCCALLSRHISR